MLRIYARRQPVTLANDIQFKVIRANKKGSYYTCKKLANSCVFLCSYQGTCRCSTDEQSITYNNEVIVEKKVRVDLLLLINIFLKKSSIEIARWMICQNTSV